MKPRRITIDQRVDAVWRAVYLIDGDKSRHRASIELIVLLRAPRVDLDRIRSVLDRMLAYGIADVAETSVAYHRLRIAEVETALGLDHHPLAAEALDAWEAGTGGIDRGAPWRAYVGRLDDASAAGVAA